MADDKKRDATIEMGEKMPNGNGSAHFDAQPKPLEPRPAKNVLAGSVTNNPVIAITAYCGSSILMTVTNKYVLSGNGFNMNFLLLAVQSIVCILAIQTAKSASLISFRDFHRDEARKWFPISLLLIGMIYTSTKALQYLSIPVYTIFKNLTIILIAYGEVLWFGGSVTSMALLSFGLMVASSVIAAWADIQHALTSYGGDAVSGEAAEKISTLNAGYLWMMFNCFCSATFLLAMRKRIKLTNFSDYDKTRTWIFSTMVISGLSSVFISYTSAWCVRITSSTTYSMVGALNKLPIAISGLVFFDAPVTIPSVSAIGVGFVSGLVYAVAKVRQKKDAASKGGPAGGSVLPTTSASVQSMRDSLKS
ncbi:GDP-mannose transporter into the lumen of the Golgi [Recurvomyces mirabilis]|uniref:GDP-mannose transporter n=1 Tax=Recurvomyces mirabilis TaxID=574656 RepID=A0AAE0WR44_9PEZI|nr:GDP-mannose transporter into the lumen of the Golgi [Recurvomyces mirabilis]KAK5154849.1 GDP-mannose transporter into the lumen of the Golgi [Recurvomyces mirabilis]